MGVITYPFLHLNEPILVKGVPEDICLVIVAVVLFDINMNESIRGCRWVIHNSIERDISISETNISVVNTIEFAEKNNDIFRNVIYIAMMAQILSNTDHI